MATLFEGDPKGPFSIATTPRCRGGNYFFPGLLHFTLDAYLIMLSVKQGGIKYHFLSLRMTRPGIEAWTPGPLVNTLLMRPIAKLSNLILFDTFYAQVWNWTRTQFHPLMTIFFFFASNFNEKKFFISLNFKGK